MESDGVPNTYDMLGAHCATLISESSDLPKVRNCNWGSDDLYFQERMARPKIKLYLDIVSPFAYLAFHVIRVSESLKDSC